MGINLNQDHSHRRSMKIIQYPKYLPTPMSPLTLMLVGAVLLVETSIASAGSTCTGDSSCGSGEECLHDGIAGTVCPEWCPIAEWNTNAGGFYMYCTSGASITQTNGVSKYECPSGCKCCKEKSSSAKKDTGTCTRNQDCVSDRCGSNSICCKDAGRDGNGLSTGCTKCYSSDGSCQECTENYYLKDYSCVACPSGKTSAAGSTAEDQCRGPPKVAAGESCLRDEDCESGSCANVCLKSESAADCCRAFSSTEYKGQCYGCTIGSFLRYNPQGENVCTKCPTGKTSKQEISSIGGCTKKYKLYDSEDDGCVPLVTQSARGFQMTRRFTGDAACSEPEATPSPCGVDLCCNDGTNVRVKDSYARILTQCRDITNGLNSAYISITPVLKNGGTEYPCGLQSKALEGGRICGLSNDDGDMPSGSHEKCASGQCILMEDETTGTQGIFVCMEQRDVGCYKATKDGRCAKCAANYALQNGHCVRCSAGRTTYSNNEGSRYFTGAPFCCREPSGGVGCASNTCNEAGYCTRCKANFVPANGGGCQPCESGTSSDEGATVCLKNNGQLCSSSDQCSSSVCRDGRCCSSSLSQCVKCSNNGLECITFGGGASCTSESQCSSEKCLGGTCCNDGGTHDKCARCNSKGTCSECDHSSYLKGDDCVEKITAGGLCSSNDMCVSNSCKGGICCGSLSAADGDCEACSFDRDGACKSCSSNYAIAIDGVCKKKKDNENENSQSCQPEECCCECDNYATSSSFTGSFVSSSCTSSDCESNFGTEKCPSTNSRVVAHMSSSSSESDSRSSENSNVDTESEGSELDGSTDTISTSTGTGRDKDEENHDNGMLWVVITIVALAIIAIAAVLIIRNKKVNKSRGASAETKTSVELVVNPMVDEEARDSLPPLHTVMKELALSSWLDAFVLYGVHTTEMLLDEITETDLKKIGMRTNQRMRLMQRINQLQGLSSSAEKFTIELPLEQEGIAAEPANKNWKRRFSVASSTEYYENVLTGKVQSAPPTTFGSEENVSDSGAGEEHETLEDMLKTFNLAFLTEDIMNEFNGDVNLITSEWMDDHCGRLQKSRLATLIAKMNGSLWYTGSTGEYEWWKNAVTGELQYYAPTRTGSMCIPLEDGYFKEGDEEETELPASQPQPRAAQQNWKKAKLKLKMVQAFSS